MIGHELRESDAHEMPVAVEDQHARHGLARRHLKRREHLRQRIIGSRYRAEIGAPAIAAPMGAGGDDDAVGTVAQHIVDAHSADP